MYCGRASRTSRGGREEVSDGALLVGARGCSVRHGSLGESPARTQQRHDGDGRRQAESGKREREGEHAPLPLGQRALAWWRRRRPCACSTWQAGGCSLRATRGARSSEGRPTRRGRAKVGGGWARRRRAGRGLGGAACRERASRSGCSLACSAPDTRRDRESESWRLLLVVEIVSLGVNRRPSSDHTAHTHLLRTSCSLLRSTRHHRHACLSGTLSRALSRPTRHLVSTHRRSLAQPQRCVRPACDPLSGSL